MENNYGMIATPVLHLMKKSIKRTYILLVVFIILFVISITDSIYQRCRVIKVLKEYDVMMNKTLKIIEEEIKYEHSHEE